MAAQRRPALPGRQPTRWRTTTPCALSVAQRRPALPGRQPAFEERAVLTLGVNAQRRPALPGRQPAPAGVAADDRGCRSTKAGPSGPATLCLAPPRSASARPRSTKAGPSGPATRVLWVGRSLWWFHRSTKAGPSGPATHGRRRRSRRHAQPLNEGRPFRAGNPGHPGALPGGGDPRSTKAGPSGPATRLWDPAKALPRVLAQRRPALPGRQPRGGVARRRP